MSMTVTRPYSYQEIMAGNGPKLPTDYKLMLLTGSWTQEEAKKKIDRLFGIEEKEEEKPVLLYGVWTGEEFAALLREA